MKLIGGFDVNKELISANGGYIGVKDGKEYILFLRSYDVETYWELDIGSKILHPSLLSMKHFCLSASSVLIAYPSVTPLENYYGSSFEKLSFEQKEDLVLQLFSGIEALHSLGLYHHKLDHNALYIKDDVLQIGRVNNISPNKDEITFTQDTNSLINISYYILTNILIDSTQSPSQSNLLTDKWNNFYRTAVGNKFSSVIDLISITPLSERELFAPIYNSLPETYKITCSNELSSSVEELIEIGKENNLKVKTIFLAGDYLYRASNILKADDMRLIMLGCLTLACEVNNDKINSLKDLSSPYLPYGIIGMKVRIIFLLEGKLYNQTMATYATSINSLIAGLELLTNCETYTTTNKREYINSLNSQFDEQKISRDITVKELK